MINSLLVHKYLVFILYPPLQFLAVTFGFFNTKSFTFSHTQYFVAHLIFPLPLHLQTRNVELESSAFIIKKKQTKTK